MSEYTHQAAPISAKHVPAFIVKKDDNERTHTHRFLDKNGSIQSKEVKMPGGFIVAFPVKGHSIRVKDEAELKRLGFDKIIPLLDVKSDDADEPVSYLPNSVTSSTKGA